MKNPIRRITERQPEAANLIKSAVHPDLASDQNYQRAEKMEVKYKNARNILNVASVLAIIGSYEKFGYAGSVPIFAAAFVANSCLVNAEDKWQRQKSDMQITFAQNRVNKVSSATAVIKNAL